MSLIAPFSTASASRGMCLAAGRGTRTATAVAMCLLGLLLAGCSGSFAPSRPAAVSTAPKPDAEQTAVEREHQRILTAYGGAYEDARLQTLISQAVDKLVAASEQPSLAYRVTILNSPAINAFALPTGQLYVTRGLIALASDTSELASVLAHEMAHVIARHAAIRADQARQAALVSRVVNDVLSDPQTGALALAKSKIALASFSRAQEFEADGIGVGIAARAGYDPYGAVRFLTAMGRNADLKASAGNTDGRPLDFLSSHPATPERVGNAQTSARQFSAPGAGAQDKPAYLAGIDGMVYGEDPSEGYVRGRRFLHPKLGFTFTAPEDFTLDNTAQAVLGIKQGGGQALRVDVVRVPAEQKLTEYLNSGWIENIDPRSIEEMTLNGFPSASATAKGDQWAFRLYAVRFGSEVYRFIFATKQKTPETERVFRQSVESFRRMSLTEIESAKPLRLKVVSVAPGDTVETFAAQMAVLDRPAERFRVLNGLAANEQVKPGDQVKIVTE